MCLAYCILAYRIFARIGRTFLHRTQGYEKGVRPIHKARNLMCFTSSAQATLRSQIDDQPLPQPVSITARVWFDFNCVSNMFSTSLTVQLLFVISDLSSRFYFKHNNYNTLHECPSPYYNQRNVCPNPLLVSKMTPISFICNLKIARDMGRKGGASYTQG